MNQSHSDDLLTVIISYTASFFGQLALFGVEVLKAAILGFVGAGAGLFAKYLYNKYIRK
jgi:hypothetical protein